MKKKKRKSIKQWIAEREAKQRITKGGRKKGEFLHFLFSMLNRYVFVFVGIGVLYIVLLLMLVHVEKNVPGSNIHNLGQAIWYSLATFTTVGYGDLYPVSGWGRVVASVFLILGIGLLSFFVGFMVEFIARVRPIIILTTHADKPWYIFTDRSPHAVIFAENLKQVRPDALIIYAETKSENAKSSKELAVLWTVDELVQKRGSLYDLHIMCMKENEMENFLDAVRLAEIDVPIICLANFMPSHYPMNINFFSLKDCTARVFWQQYPVEKKDETIILIGFGQAGHMLLDRGLELNVLYKDQNIRYHVFGQGDDYCLNRKLLSDFVSINEESNERDSIIFHKDAWNNDEDLLRNADRIILASDSEWENIDILHTIQKFFSIKGELFIYNSNVRSVATSFGQARDILTPAFVLHNRLTDMALCRHEMFRFYSGEDIAMWENISSLAKDMNYSATDHISIKVRIALGNEAPHSPFDEISPETLRKAASVYHSADEKEKASFLALEHERCLRFYKIHNYRFGEKTDDNARTSPLVCSFEELSEQKKMVAETGWMLLDELASHKEARRK